MYCSNNRLNLSLTIGDNTPFLFRILAYLASWLILLPHRPNSAPVLSKKQISSLALTIVSRASCKRRLRTKSDLRTPSVFSSSRITLYSSSVNRASTFLILFPCSFIGLPFERNVFVIRGNELRVPD